MQRLTKAALATGAAAVLLLGGAGTMAYWTGTATATASAELEAGTFTVEPGSSCGNWTYVNDTTPVTLIVPGDTVTITCNFTLDATGDHVALGGAKVSPITWKSATSLTAELVNPTVSAVQVVASGGGGKTVTPDPSTGLFQDGALGVPSGATVSVTISVQFPYGDATTTSLDDTQQAIAQLNDISVTLIQGNTMPTA